MADLESPPPADPQRPTLVRGGFTKKGEIRLHTVDALREPWKVPPLSHAERGRMGQEKSTATKRRLARPTPQKQGAKKIFPAACETRERDRRFKLNRSGEITLRAKAEALGLPIAPYVNTLSMAVRRMDGGRDQFLTFVALAASDNDEDAIKVIETFESLTAMERKSANLDLLCQASGVSPVSLLKTVVGIAFETNVETANLIAAAAHPNVVATAVRSAQRANSKIGQQDRQALLQHHGFLPTPKGATINVNANASAAAVAGASAAGPIDASIPSFLMDAQVSGVARDRVQQQLIAAGLDDAAEDPFADLRVRAPEPVIIDVTR
jgi:hypothetical protein